MSGNNAERRERLIYAEWWTPAETAFMLGIAKSSVTRWIAAGLAHESGVDHLGHKRLRLRRVDVIAWVMDETRRTRLVPRKQG